MPHPSLPCMSLFLSISLEIAGDGTLQQVLSNLLEPVPDIEDIYATHSTNPSLSPEPTRASRSRGEPATKKRKSNASAKVKENAAANAVSHSPQVRRPQTLHPPTLDPDEADSVPRPPHAAGRVC